MTIMLCMNIAGGKPVCTCERTRRTRTSVGVAACSRVSAWRATWREGQHGRRRHHQLQGCFSRRFLDRACERPVKKQAVYQQAVSRAEHAMHRGVFLAWDALG